jgi:hypothetical protein
MNFRLSYIPWLILAFGIYLSSCSGSVPEMKPEERFAADTIYSNRLPEWRTTVDSICQLQQDSIYVKAVDSIRQERMEEIEMLLRKN